MAYGISIPGRSVASNYAASFRPVGVAPGFSQVKSDLVANYLMQVPMLRQKLEMDLAKQALAEVGATKRLDKKLDAELELAAKRDKVNKLLTIAGMSGGDEGGSGLGSLSGLNTFDQLVANMETRDRNKRIVTQNDLIGRVNTTLGKGGQTQFGANVSSPNQISIEVPDQTAQPQIELDINSLLRQAYNIEE